MMYTVHMFMQFGATSLRRPRQFVSVCNSMVVTYCGDCGIAIAVSRLLLS